MVDDSTSFRSATGTCEPIEWHRVLRPLCLVRNDIGLETVYKVHRTPYLGPADTQRISYTHLYIFIMSDLKATVAETKNGFHVEGYEKIEYDFTFMDGVFNPANLSLPTATSDGAVASPLWT